MPPADELGASVGAARVNSADTVAGMSGVAVGFGVKVGTGVYVGRGVTVGIGVSVGTGVSVGATVLVGVGKLAATIAATVAFRSGGCVATTMTGVGTGVDVTSMTWTVLDPHANNAGIKNVTNPKPLKSPAPILLAGGADGAGDGGQAGVVGGAGPEAVGDVGDGQAH